MVNMTLSIPEELHKKMKKLKLIKWSEVARQAIEQRIEDMEMVEKLVGKSELTKKEANELADEIKKGIAKRHGLKV